MINLFILIVGGILIICSIIGLIYIVLIGSIPIYIVKFTVILLFSYGIFILFCGAYKIYKLKQSIGVI